MDVFITWLQNNESAFASLAALLAITAVLIKIVIPLLHSLYTKISSKEKQADEDTNSSNSNVERKPYSGSVAVLPFAAQSSKEEDQYIARGISSEIIADLVQVPEFQVSSNLATQKFMSDDCDLADIAGKLNVRYIVSGRLLRLGETIQVSAELTDTQDGQQIWSGQYRQELRNIFDLQENISEALCLSLDGEIKANITKVARQTSTSNVDAWSLYQKAFHFWHNAYSLEAMNEAQSLLEDALEIDPEYPEALAYLAMIISNRYIGRFSRDPETDGQRRLDLVDKALKAAPKNVEVLAYSGLVLYHAGENQRAIRILRQAVQQTPKNTRLKTYLCGALGLSTEMSDVLEGQKIIAHNIEIAPNHPSIAYSYYWQSVLLSRTEDYQAAAAAAESALVLQPAWFHAWYVAANAYAAIENHSRATECFAIAKKTNPMMDCAAYIELMKLGTQNNQTAYESLIKGLNLLILEQEPVLLAT